MVLIAPPPPLRPPTPLFQDLPGGTSLVRLFLPAAHGVGPLTFRAFGPLRRFDHHEGIPRGRGRQPSLSSSRRVYYAAPTLSCCIAEVFGDLGLIEPGEWHVALPLLIRPLRLLDLRGAGALRAGSVAALTQMPDHRLGQAWSRHFYDDRVYGLPDGLPDGLLYAGAHNGEDAVLLYERAEAALSCAPGDVLRLDDPALRPALLDIALANNLILALPP